MITGISKTDLAGTPEVTDLDVHTLSTSGPSTANGSGHRLRVMHVIDRLDIGGTEKVLMKLIEHLDTDTFEHSVCTLRGVSDHARSWNSSAVLLDAGTGGRNFQLNIPRLARLMRTLRPHIVHSRNWGGIEAIPAARLAGVPVIIHSEHGYQLEMQQGLPWRQRIFRHFAYRHASVVFAVTDELRSYHESQAGYRAGAIQVIHNGVDDVRFSPRPETRVRVRQALKIPENKVVVGFVGRLVALKDVMTLLRAVETVESEGPGIHALLVGSGPDLPRLQQYVQQSSRLAGHVTFAGPSEHVPDLLNAMDIFVLTSLLEGMSNTLLEAMATGLPVIATRVGGNPEIVREGSCGYLFPAGDVASLSGYLQQLLQDGSQRVRLGKAARELVSTHFSLNSMLRRYSDLYLGLAQRNGVEAPARACVRN